MTFWNIVIIRALPLLVQGIILAGCATLMNNDQVSVSVYTRPTGLRMHVAGDSITYTTPAILHRRRSSEDLHLTFVSDSARKQVVVPSKFSGWYWLNLYPPFWPGLLLDGDRKYTYDDEVFVAINDTAHSYWTWDVFDGPNTLRWGMNLSFYGMGGPEFVWNVFENNGSQTELLGINSLGLMLQYLAEPHSLYILSADARSTVFGECFENCSDSRGTLSLAMFYGQEWGDLWPDGWLAAGVHGTFTALNSEEFTDTSRVITINRTAEIGPAFSGAVRFLGRYSWLVVSYQPSIYEFDRRQFIYSHQLSFALRFLFL